MKCNGILAPSRVVSGHASQLVLFSVISWIVKCCDLKPTIHEGTRKYTKPKLVLQSESILEQWLIIRVANVYWDLVHRARPRNRQLSFERKIAK